ncbi:Rrp6 [Kluyveromyces lactis]|nr:Rrp6 [Kluyveromyces lactis]
MSSDDKDTLLSSLVQTVRSSSALAAQDIDFYKSLDSNINASLEDTSTNILSLINDLLLSIDPNNDVIQQGKDSFVDSWKSISNIMDNLFEKSDHALDNIRAGNTGNTGGPSLKYLNDDDRSNNKPSKRIEKPQLSFKNPVDNTELHPFKPLLEYKLNSLQPFEISSKMVPEEEFIPAHYPHPYEYEIDHQKYNDSILVVTEPIPSKDWDETEAIWVDTVEGLYKMKDELGKATELAIDLEHHDYRSYYGIVCLMQISDREHDWIVDTIALREELYILNDIFTDPDFTKVMHGAFMDIIWLQRDLGLYIVGLFDTYHASRMLGFPKHSLAYLLERFANFKTSKKYQLADWRIRPLTKPMLAYARADTHFLLNIFDKLRNSLLEQNKMSDVLHESRKVAKRRFEYSSFRPKVPSSAVFSPIEKEEPWKNIMFQYNIPASKELLLRRLYEWRDTIARRDDESPRYVMPNQLLVSLVAGAPTEPINVLSVSSYVSEHVRTNSKVIANLIKRTLEDLKGNSNSSANPLLESAESNGTDLANIITTSQIKSIQNIFHSLASEINSQKQNNEQHSEKSILFNDISNLDVNTAVRYTPKTRTLIPQHELLKRQHEITRTLEQEYTDRQAQSIVLPSNEDEAPMQVSNDENRNELNTSDPAQEEIEENKDEVITLRKRQSQSTNKRKTISPPPSHEIIDYAAGSDLLNSTRNNANSQRHKKRRFDPYSVEHVGPQPIKKKSKPAKGKNVSFKR